MEDLDRKIVGLLASDGRMSFGLVSDLNEAELREFVHEWSAK